MKKKYLTTIYLAVVLIMLSAEPNDEAPVFTWLSYYGFLLINLANAARLANKHFKSSDYEITRN